MEAKKTVTINGRAYDEVTGLPVDRPAKTAPRPAALKRASTARPASTTSSGNSAAGPVHGSPQRSTTLHRRATKKPGLPKRPQPGRHMDIARNGSVKRFAAQPAGATPVAKKAASADIQPKTHPLAHKATSKMVKRPVQTLSPKQTKDAAIAHQLAKPSEVKRTQKKRPLTQKTRRTIMSFGVVALILGAGALAYFQLPGISVAIASQQAGVSAAYPGYVPTGYSLAQPVTYSDGEVSLRFTANSGTGEYTVTQARSNWDSAAVLDNVVRPASGDNYIITQERGLTMYAFDGNAAWVNGGVLYTIESDAALSGDQIRRIATSL